MESTPTTFTVALDEKNKHLIDAAKLVQVREETIDEHLAEQPSVFLRIACLTAAASALADRLEADLDVEEATKAQKLRAGAASRDIKVTDKAVAEQMTMDRDLIDLRRALGRANEQVELLKAVKEALIHRKECIITLAADLRANRDVDLRINEKSSKGKKK